MSKRTELVLLAPRLLPLTSQRRRAAVRLLSELVLEEVSREPGERIGAAGGEGAGVVVPFPARNRRRREAA
jgi:hypothetical protein